MQPGDYIQTTSMIHRFGRKPIPKGARGSVLSIRDGGAFVDFHTLQDNCWLLPKEAAVIVKGTDA